MVCSASVRQPSFESMLSLVGLRCGVALLSVCVHEAALLPGGAEGRRPATARAMVIGQLRGMTDAGIDLEQRRPLRTSLPGEPI